MNLSQLTRRQAVAATLAVPGLALALPRSSGAAKLGLSLPLSGAQKEAGEDMLAGYKLAVKSGQLPLELLVLDDKSNADLARRNTETFAQDATVVAVSGLVGTPQAEAAMPVAVQHGLPLIGMRSGANSLRKGDAGVFHLRVSYEQECDKIVKLCQGGGLKALAVLYSSDSFGTSLNEHIQRFAKDVGLPVLATVPAKRAGEDVASAAAALVKSINLQAGKAAMGVGVCLPLITSTMSMATRELRERHKYMMPLFALSNVLTNSIAVEPQPFMEGLGVTLALPLPWASAHPLAARFRADNKRFGSDLDMSMTVMEGYWYGSVVGAAFKKSGPNRQAIKAALASGSIACCDVPLSFNGADKSGFNFLDVAVKSPAGKIRT